MNKTYNLTPLQQGVIVDSLRDRIGKLFNMAQDYKYGGNTEAELDCLREMRLVSKVLDDFRAM